MANPISLNQISKKETVIASVGGAVFATSTIALVILLALHVNIGIAGQMSLHGGEVVGLALFSVGCCLRRSKIHDAIEKQKADDLEALQQKHQRPAVVLELEQPPAPLNEGADLIIDDVPPQQPSSEPVAQPLPIDSNNPDMHQDLILESSIPLLPPNSAPNDQPHQAAVAPIIAEDDFEPLNPPNVQPQSQVAQPPANPLTFQETLDLIQTTLDTLHTSLSKFLVAFAKAYARSIGKEKGFNPKKITDSLKTIFETLNAILKDSDQRKKTTFIIFIYSHLNKDRFLGLQNQQILSHFSSVLKLENLFPEILEKLHPLLKQLGTIKLDSEITDAFEDWKKGVSAEQDANPLSAIKKKANNEEALGKLLALLYDKAKFNTTDTQAFFESIITAQNSLLEDTQEIYDGFRTKSEDLKDQNTSDPNGETDDGSGLDMMPGKAVRAALYYAINSALGGLGLNKKYFDSLECCYVSSGPIDTLVVALYDPIVEGVMKKESPFAKALIELIKSSNIDLPEANVKTPQELVRILAEIFDEKWTKAFDGMVFAKK